MKLLIICALLTCLPAIFGFIVISLLDPSLHKRENECVGQSGVSFAAVENVRKTRDIPDNDRMRVFAKCMMQYFNVINNDGSVNEDVRSYRLPNDVASASWSTSTDCKAMRGDNRGDYGRKIMNCFLNRGEIVMGSDLNPMALTNA